MHNKQITTQSFNFPIVLRFMGWLLMIEAGFMALPAVVSLIFSETATALQFACSAAVTAVCGALMTFGIRPSSMTMRKREGIFLTAIVWVLFSAFGMLPFLLSGSITNVTDAYFETMSGFTTTGASVIRHIDNLPHGILFWRSLTHWIGGMGIILFTLAVLPMLNYKGGISLFNAEVTGITHERMRPRISQTAKDLWLVYIVLTVVMTLLLIPPMGWFDALCHTLATVSTGGFSTKDNGLIYWSNHYVDAVVLVFMFLGGINFTLLWAAACGDFKPLRRSDTFKWYTWVVIGTSVIIIARMAYEGFCPTWLDRVMLATFDTVSAITSTGFSTIDYEQSGEFISFLLMVVMFFGGMAGSTAGGAKIDRMIVMLKNTKNEFYRVLHPNSVRSVWVDNRAISHDVAAKCVAFLAIFVLIIVVSALLLVLMGMPIFDSLFTSMSAISNIGMGYGVTGINGSFANVPCLGKWLLVFDMLIGRLELFTVLVVFTRDFWVKE